jgi:transcriptional regulator with XRE-family HTH domain
MKRRNPVLKAFGQNVRVHRATKHLTQEILAKKARIHRSYLCDVEGGTRNVTLKNIVRIARALDISAARLMKWVG